jgi:hypothetical protein
MRLTSDSAASARRFGLVAFLLMLALAVASRRADAGPPMPTQCLTAQDRACLRPGGYSEGRQCNGTTDCATCCAIMTADICSNYGTQVVGYQDTNCGDAS